MIGKITYIENMVIKANGMTIGMKEVKHGMKHDSGLPPLVQKSTEKFGRKNSASAMSEKKHPRIASASESGTKYEY